MSLAAGRLSRDGSGAVLIEFALTLPLLLLIITGIFDFGLLFRQYGIMTNAAREGARMAVLPGYTQADVQDRVNKYVETSGVRNPPLTLSQPLPIPLGDGREIPAMKVTVRFDYTFTFLGPIAKLFGGSFGTYTFEVYSHMRTEVPAGAI